MTTGRINQVYVWPPSQNHRSGETEQPNNRINDSRTEKAFNVKAICENVALCYRHNEGQEKAADYKHTLRDPQPTVYFQYHLRVLETFQ